MSIEPTMTFHCFFCAKPFERDNHVYHGNPIAYRGTYIGRYMIEVCDGCHDGNPTAGNRTLRQSGTLEGDGIADPEAE